MMVLEEVSPEKYHEIVKSYKYFYNSTRFHDLNKYKVQKVVYLLFKTKKYKIGIIAGIHDKVFKVPYSAPFSMFEFLSVNVRLDDICSAVCLIDDYVKEKQLSAVEICLPPSFYDRSGIAKVQNSLLNNGYNIAVCDLNFQFFLKNMLMYRTQLHRNARKNLEIANRQGFILIHCETEGDKRRAYDIIKMNRDTKGRPLRMTYEQITDTIKLTEHDFFIARLGDVDVAAAIVFRINEAVYQVIYWGDVGGYSEKKPMNYISAQLYEFYADRGVLVLDIGPSTEEGMPNFGLCDFKESIGCEIDTKYTFRKNF